MIQLSTAVAAWGRPDFEETLQQQLQRLDVTQLPLQQGLSSSSYALDQPFQVMINSVADRGDHIVVTAGIFYAGMIAGCSCADDPTPEEQQPEYCEIKLDIDKASGATQVALLDGA